MFTKNIKDFKNASYIFLTILSTAEAGTINSHSQEYLNHSVKGRRLEVPYEKERLIDMLEKKVDLLFENYDTQKDEIQRDIKSPVMDMNRENYNYLKNKVINKYEKERAELARFRTSLSKSPEKLTLSTQARGFVDLSRQLKQKLEEEEKDLQKTAELTINVGSSLLETVIEHKANNSTKKVLLDMLDKAKKGILNFFKQ